MFVVALSVAIAAVWGITSATDARVAEVERVGGLAGLLAGSVDADGNLVDADGNILDDPVDLPSQNYLLVGSDTREGISADDPDFGVIGDTGVVSGRRADTIMVLRRERDGGASLVSLPRDLWVNIPGRGENRINAAYNSGADQLIATVTQTLGIPIDHYVEVNFVGFRDIVNELGGVTICFPHPTRDPKTGLDQPAGCNLLDGLQGLAYSRSRTYQEFREGEWRTEPTADIGRTQRQQLFIRAAADAAIARLTDQPFASGELIQAVAASVRVDELLDPFLQAAALKQAYDGGLTTYSLPVYGDNVGGASVLRLGEGSGEILDYFRGIGPAPTED
ncbi:MAG: LCP family protein, partial [Ilumatobacteraceae bacterium]|jgi:LCP family protein required for cell wall assembly